MKPHESNSQKADPKGLLVQIQHFSVHDGEGIRITLFMAG